MSNTFDTFMDLAIAYKCHQKHHMDFAWPIYQHRIMLSFQTLSIHERMPNDYVKALNHICEAKKGVNSRQ